MFEQAFRNIDDALRKEAGCATELDYAEQTSWLLFLKYLDGLEHDKEAEALLEGRKHAPILEKKFRWESWAAPKNAAGKIDENKALSGNDLRDFVDDELFPYLRKFKQRATGPNTIEYKIGEIFGELKNKITSGYILRDIIDEIFMKEIDQNEKTLVFCATRGERAAKAKVEISTHFNSKEQVFLDFVLSHYIAVGVEELDQAKLGPLLKLKYHDSISDAVADLGAPDQIGQVFAGFQKYLYDKNVA